MLRSDTEGNAAFLTLKRAFEQLPISLCVLTLDLNLLYANKSALALVGYTEREFLQTDPKTISSIFTPEEFSGSCQRLLHSTEQQVNFSSTIIRKNGEKLACNLHLSLLEENQMQFILLSITEEKKEEDVLKKANMVLEKKVAEKTAALSAVFERITDGFTAFDKDWNYTYVNKKAAETANRRPEDMIGKNVWKEFPEIVETSLYHTYHKAMKEQVVIRTEEYVAFLGKWFEGVLYPSPEGLSVFFQDITETKKAQFALQDQELMYRTIVETTQEGIWQIDPENRTSFVNDYLPSLLGYTKEEMMGRPFLDFMTTEARLDALNLVEERKRGIAKQHEFTFLRKNGTPVHTLLRASPVIRNGHYAGAIATVLDNSKQKEAIEKLAESERRFRALFEYSQDGIALLTAKGIIVNVSPSIEKFLGLAKEELIGTDRLDFIVPEDVHIIYETFEDILKEPLRRKTVEYRVIAKDGTLKWLESTFSNLLGEPAVRAIVLNLRDVTERKNAENRIKQSEAKYRKAQTQGRLGHWEWLPKTGQLTWSDEIYAMFGLNPETHIPDYEKFLGCVHPEDRTSVETTINQAIANSNNYEVTYRIVLEDESIRFVYMLADLVKNSSGELVKVVGMVQDVTAQKLIERELSLSEQNYRLLFEKSPVPFWMADYPSFNFIESNQAATELYGYSREEFLSMNVRDIRVDNAENYFQEVNASVPVNSTKRSIAQHRKKNGDLVTVQLTVSRVSYNGRLVWLASTSDITYEMLYATQLQEKEQQLSLIFNSTLNGMTLFKVEKDGQFRYEAVNEALCKRLQLESEQVLGKLLEDVFSTNDVQHLLLGLRNAVTTGKVQNFTAKNTQRLGNRIVEYTAIPIKNHLGEVIQVLSVSNDVTDKK